LSYSYQKHPPAELEKIAAIIHSRYAHRCSGYYVDVEGIAEDCQITILPRRGGLRKYVEGYVPVDPHFIVVAEQLTSYAPRYRPVIAEELCHIILEYDLLSAGAILPEAEPHKLTADQHRDIEADARFLALAVLFPAEMFRDRFSHHLQNAPQGMTSHGDRLRYCAQLLETDFHVWDLQAAYRARDLGLITEAECRREFSERLGF
jgi:Zn-dependent peptidase ImmA (M78 family)